MKRRETIDCTGGKGRDIVSIVLATSGHMGCLIASAKKVVFFGPLMFVCFLVRRIKIYLTDFSVVES